MLAKGWVQRIIDRIDEKTEGIAMQQQQSQQGERDRIGRILARQSRVAERVARHFDNPESELARELRDILAHVPEPREVWDRELDEWRERATRAREDAVVVDPQTGAVDW